MPPGFRAQVYASGLNQPTAMAFGPDRRLYVTEATGAVVTVAPGSHRPTLFAGRIPSPLGLAWIGRRLFVSAQGQVERLTLERGRAVGRRTIVRGLPFGLHQQDNIVVGPGRRLYLGSGSTCDVCRERSRYSATILSVLPSGRGLRVVASGTRNPYGLAVQPGTGQLYATVNGQDDLGTASDPEPADMLVRVVAGGRYGWPVCWPDARRLALVGDCRGVRAPAAYLGPHASADGLAFYTGRSFPAAYRGNAFVAEWGQYLTTAGPGQRVVRIVLDPRGAATTSRTSVFARGFEHPIAVVVDPRGALLVADWGKGVIYRIQARRDR
ncbi:MAG TPA: PQQ-dependent sugar dehydrogenase [Candidatus Micrarchaeia archaeon]|nr:PQQ-dependent sugar dehydrogenase [Candidatus Micrarchaeia archaeon]